MSKENKHHTDYIQAIPNAERRFVPTQMEIRADDEKGTTVQGIAAKINSRTNLGWFDEMIMPGAFDECLTDDIRCLFNHDPNQVLARTKSGTLEVFLNAEGHLAYRYKTPERSYAKDLEDAIRSGDVDQCSFAFQIKEASWEFAETREGNDLRKIIKVERLLDVSPVTYPAYQDTSVALRSHEATQPQRKEACIGRSLNIAKRKIQLLTISKK